MPTHLGLEPVFTTSIYSLTNHCKINKTLKGKEERTDITTACLITQTKQSNGNQIEKRKILDVLVAIDKRYPQKN